MDTPKKRTLEIEIPPANYDGTCNHRCMLLDFSTDLNSSYCLLFPEAQNKGNNKSYPPKRCPSYQEELW